MTSIPSRSFIELQIYLRCSHRIYQFALRNVTGAHSVVLEK